MVMSVLAWVSRKEGLRQKVLWYYFIKRAESPGNRMWKAGKVGGPIRECVTELVPAWSLTLVGPSSKRPFGWWSLRTLPWEEGGKSASTSSPLHCPHPHHYHTQTSGLWAWVRRGVTGSSTNRDAPRQEAQAWGGRCRDEPTWNQLEWTELQRTSGHSPRTEKVQTVCNVA